MKPWRTLRRFSFIFLTTVFIWTVPWGAEGRKESISPKDMISNEELRHFLSMFDHKSPTTMSPSHKSKATPPSTSFIPTEIFPLTTLKGNPFFRRQSGTVPAQKSETSPTELHQQISLLNALLNHSESERNVNEKVKGVQNGSKKEPKLSTPSTTPAPSFAKEEAEAAAALQSLALLTALLSPEQTHKSVNSNAGATLLGLNTRESETVAPPALRQMDDKEAAAFLLNLLSQSSVNQPKPQQNFNGFTNTQLKLDGSSSNQLSSLIGLLGTIGSLSNTGANILSMGQQPQNPGLLSLLGGQSNQGVLGNMLGLSQQTRNAQQQMSLLSSLLGKQNGGSPLVNQHRPQSPGVINSLLGLGSSVSSVLGQALQGLSGTRPDGKPRVRGFDTRVGLGYRMGQNMDAQLMWELGPQIFTEPLENEKRTIRVRQPQISPEVQKQLMEYLSKQQLQKRRHLALSTKEEVEHGRLREPVLGSQSQRVSRILTPRSRIYSQHHFSPFSYYNHHYQQIRIPRFNPIPNGHIQPPTPIHPVYPRSHYSLLTQASRPIPKMRKSLPFYSKTPSTLLPAPPGRNYHKRYQKRSEDSYGMLTSYEKWLMKQAQTISKRILRVDENGHWAFPSSPSLSASEVKPFTPHASNKSPTKEAGKSSGRKIVRIRKKLEGKDSMTLASDRLLRRMGSMRPPPPPFRPIVPIHPPMHNPHLIRRVPISYHPYYRGRMYPQRRFYPRPPSIPMPSYSHYRPPSVSYYNPYQNFIPESEDSFIRRNAIVTKPKSKVEDERLGTNFKEGLDVEDLTNQIGASASELQPVAMIGGALKKVIDPVTRFLFPTTAAPAPDDHTGGDYNPTNEPPLIATPFPTPIPSFYDHLGRPKTTKPPSPPDPMDEVPYIHIGEELSYGELTNMVDLRLRPRVRTYKNGTKTEVKAPAHHDRPLNPPGVEMFIDIDSGEVSVRKPIASLAHFGDVSTTPKPKTDDELEDEESLRIYEQLQNHFKSSMEKFTMKQELLNATKAHREKILAEEDESLGLVNRYFDLLELDDKTIDSVSLSKRRGSAPPYSSSSKNPGKKNSELPVTTSEPFVSSEGAVGVGGQVSVPQSASTVVSRKGAHPTQPTSALRPTPEFTTSSIPNQQPTSSTTTRSKSRWAKRAKLRDKDDIPSTSSSAAASSSSSKSSRHKSGGKKKGHVASSPVPTTSTSPPPPISEDSLSMDSSEEYEDSGNESSGEDVEFAMERDERGPSERSSEEEYPFSVLSTEAIVQHMVDSIREANTVLQLPTTTMRILLNHFGWDKEKLLEAYYDGDPSKLFKAARVIDPRIPRPQITNPASGAEDCHICYLQKPSSMMYGLECGHRFCTQCWSEYLTTKIMEEGMGQTIACAAHDCPILVDDATVMKLVGDPKVKLKYQHLITNSFVQCNRLMRWCPSADCTNAIRVQWVNWRPVTCQCGFVFCFQCGQAWHDPVKCSWLKRWLKKCDDDSETSNWIAANTKECPRCNATIEKDGGCNHMVCKNQNCKADFCWVCLGPWEPHGSSWYNCNRFDESEAKAARDAQEKSRAALQRYLFYCNRYMNHMQSLKFENKLYASVKDKMEEMQQHNMSWIEVQFLRKAVDILCQCRQTLMYTYVFAFYLVKNNQSVIFEDNQRDLESATEKLSEYLEREITSENLADIKQKVQDKYRYCESRRQVLLDHVYEGYEKDWWVYNETVHSQ